MTAETADNNRMRTDGLSSARRSQTAATGIHSLSPQRGAGARLVPYQNPRHDYYVAVLEFHITLLTNLHDSHIYPQLGHRAVRLRSEHVNLALVGEFGKPATFQDRN